MSYENAVAEARQLVKRSEEDQWRLAELTWQQVEAGKSRRQWAQDIGVDRSYANRLHSMWARFGGDDVATRPRFSVAYTEIAPSSGYQGRSIGAVRNLPPERKAEVARELLAEPKVQAVAEEHIASSPASVARVNQQAERRRPAPPSHVPGRNSVTAAASLAELEAAVARLRAAVDGAVSDALDGRFDRGLLAEPIGSIQVDLDRLRLAAESNHRIDTVPAEWSGGDVA